MKEEQFERNFAIFKKKVQKMMREVSQGSSRSSKFQSFMLSQSNALVNKEQIMQENNKSYTNSVRLDGDNIQNKRNSHLNPINMMVKGTSSRAEDKNDTFNRYRRVILDAKRNSHQVSNRSHN